MLLTGAGYTKNFGGFLGTEMWAKIFNHPPIQELPKVRELLMKDLDFEKTYHDVVKSNGYVPAEKEALHLATLLAYKEMHDIVFHAEGNVIGFNIHNVSKSLIDLFCDPTLGKALWFTLNQDLLMERWFWKWRIKCPGAPAFPLGAYPRGTDSPDGHATHLDSPFGTEHFVQINPNISMEEILAEIQNGPNAAYIKIHGSYGWKSSDGRRESMVLGHAKESDIENEQLLKCYYQLFKDAIAEGDKRLLIIGYGFRDEHINAVLSEGVQKHGLRIYVLRPGEPKEFRDKVLDSPGKFIWRGVHGYFQYSFRDIFKKESSPIIAQIRASMLS